MYVHLFKSLFITTSLIFFTIPQFLAKDNEQYSECSRPLECGLNYQNFKFPFWGANLPLRCGLAGFEVSCVNNDLAKINIGSDYGFRVLGINESTQEIRLAREHLPNSFCSQRLEDNMLNTDYFDYDPYKTEHLNLFDDCPNYSHLANISIDSIRGLTDDVCWGKWIANSRVFNETFSEAQKRDLGSCKAKMKVLVDVTTLEDFRYNRNISLQQVLNEVFVVKYKRNYDVSACDVCMESGGLCWSGTVLSPPTCLCRNGISQGRCRGKLLSTQAKLGAVLGAALGGVVVLICATIYVKNFLDESFTLFRRKTKNDKDVEAFIKQFGSSIIKRYKYSNIRDITNSFKFELGKGGFGNVFKGTLPDGRVVAVKVLSVSKGNGEDFINEVASIGKTCHINVVTLLGFCYEGQKRALIYEFMPNGSLEKFIHSKVPSSERPNLGCKKLYDIALGISRGLEYLHRGCSTRILHLDIKPHNILLDKDFCPKISDFGLAKLNTRAESMISTMEARGTIGYIAPEVCNRSFGRVSHKSDVYSYGMMILEMVGGRKNVDAQVGNMSEIYFPHWVYKRIEAHEKLDLGTVKDNEIARKMIIVGLWCIQMDPSQRPSMSNVIEMLEGSISALEIPPKPYMYSP